MPASIQDISPDVENGIKTSTEITGSQTCVHQGCVVPCYPHRIGRTYVWCWGKNPYHKIAPLTFFTGPDWPCMLCTYFLICFPSYFVLTDVCVTLGLWAIVVGAVSTSAVLISFTLAACSDPGIIPPRDPDLDPPVAPVGGPRMSLCSHCNVLRPPGAVHCHDCKVCVLELDHHCPWTGKCIGKRNLQYFYAFLCTLCTHLGVVMLLTVIWISVRPNVPT